MRKQSGNKPGTPEHTRDFHQENSGKGKAEEQYKNAIALLNAVIDAVSRAESYTEGLQNTLEHVCNITGWNIGEAWEPNAAGDILTYSNARYTSDKNLKGFQQISKEYSFSYGSGLPGRAWKQKSPVWIPDVKNYPDFHRAREAITFGISAGAAIPIVVDDQVVNVMVFFLKEKRDEDKDFINLISGIAKQLGELFLRKKTEEQVARLSYEYEKVFNGTQSAMFLVEVCKDRQYKYVRTNTAYERMSGCSQKDVADKTPYQEKLYRPFSQEDAATTRGYEGSGLGLSISAGIVEKLGGKIWAESEKDAGSTFYVSLPLPISEKTVNETPAQTHHTGSTKAHGSTTADSAGALPETDEPETPPKQSILLADDDDMALFLLETLIEDIGAPLISVTDGKEAVEAFRSNPGICLVIMDVKMPVMDGLEATQQIKAIRKDVPVIAVTAHAMSGDEQRILSAGCDDYIAKPLSGQELLEKINKLVPGLVEL